MRSSHHVRFGEKTIDVAMNDFIATGKIKLTISSLSQELHTRISGRGDVESIEISEQVKDKIRIVIKLQKRSRSRQSDGLDYQKVC